MWAHCFVSLAVLCCPLQQLKFTRTTGEALGASQARCSKDMFRAAAVLLATLLVMGNIGGRAAEQTCEDPKASFAKLQSSPVWPGLATALMGDDLA